MSDTHLISVGIYCDLQNVYLTYSLAKLLLAFADSKGHVISKNLYYNSQCKNQVSTKNKLEKLDFHCVDVPCVLKNSADNQLKSDLIDDIFNNSPPDIVILVSGDGDFTNSVRLLRELGKTVIVLAQRGNVKQRLKELADEFQFIDELSELVPDKTELPTNLFESHIPYEKATEYLLDAIEIALNQGKRTVLGCIDTLMRNRVPNYRGATSILKQDGTKYPRFSKFIDAVVKDGKIRTQNQELFLIEKYKSAT